MDLENVQETMILCLQIKVVFLKMFLQPKSGNAAFISSIVYATCSWCMKRLASLVWKQEDLSNNDDTLKFARESNSYKHSDVYIYTFLLYDTSLECGCLMSMISPMHTSPCHALPSDATRARAISPETRDGPRPAHHMEPTMKQSLAKIGRSKYIYI